MGNCKTLTSGICRGCRDGRGGLVSIWFANACEVDWSTLTTGTDGEITELTLINSANWHYFKPNKGTGNAKEDATISAENGTTYYKQAITASYSVNSQDMRNTFDELSKSDLIAICKDANGRMWLYGSEDNPLVADGGGSDTGTASGDLNGWKSSHSAEVNSPANEVLPSANSGLAAALATAKAACGC